MNSRLFQRDFSIMILGQIISLFGNSILRFSLSLYVLDVTGSAAVFGTILAVSMIPTVVLSPFGGVLADRLPKQKIMAILDFVTAGMIVSYDVIFGSIGSLAAVAVFMILLTLIQAFYQPAVQASIPLLAAREHLMAANGIVMQVQALAGLLGPILAGMLYGIGGVKPILAASAVCFFLSAVMELFLRIPHDKRAPEASPVRTALLDLKEALFYLIKENTCLFKLLIIVAGINLFLSALFIIGLPYLVKIYLGMSAQAYGFAEAALGLGSILGGLLSGLAGKKIKFKQSHFFFNGNAAAFNTGDFNSADRGAGYGSLRGSSLLCYDGNGVCGNVYHSGTDLYTEEYPGSFTGKGRRVCIHDLRLCASRWTGTVRRAL